MTYEEFLRKQVEKQLSKRSEFMTHLVVFAVINILLWIIGAVGSGWLSGWLGSSGIVGTALSLPWPLIVTLGWGSGLLAHGADTFFQTGDRAARQERAFREALRQTYGEGWEAKLDTKDAKALRRRVLEPFRKRAEFAIHAVVFLTINLLLWLIYLYSLPGQGIAIFSQLMAFPWPLIVLLGWGAGLAAHGVNVLTAAGVRPDAHERAVQRELARQRGDDAYDEKPKRDRLMRLGDDGELIELVDDEADADYEKPKRNASR